MELFHFKTTIDCVQTVRPRPRILRALGRLRRGGGGSISAAPRAAQLSRVRRRAANAPLPAKFRGRGLNVLK